MAIAVDEPTFVDTILFYGLFVGAIFQVICVMSVVFVPKSTEEQEMDDADHPAEPAPANTVKQSHDSARRGKKQSKKHR